MAQPVSAILNWPSLPPRSVQDIFSAIALSTEIPQDNIYSFTRPAKRRENIINSFLLKLIITQFIFQYLATILVLFFAPLLFGIE